MNQTGLAKYDAARYALSVAVEVDEVKDIRDKAAAMAAYARQAQDKELLQWATEIKVRAERRAGEMMRDTEKNKGLKGSIVSGTSVVPVRDNTPTLADMGISKNESSRWQKLAAVSNEKFEEAVGRAQVRRFFTIRRVYCGANLLPQCLHLRASRKTNSRQSGHLTCVSGFGPSETISRFLVTSTKMSPSSGEMKSDRKNQPIPLRPRLWARIPTATENKGQKITYSMTTLFFGKF